VPPPPETTVVETVAAQPKPRPWLRNKPDTLAYIGHLWSYAPKVKPWSQVQISLRQGPQGLGVEEGLMRFLPMAAGQHRVLLDLFPAGKNLDGENPEKIPLKFQLHVVPAVTLEAKTTAPRAMSGQPAALQISLRTAAHLPWPVLLQVQAEGDSPVDSVWSPGASEAVWTHTWQAAGKYPVRFFATVDGHREDSVSVSVEILSPVGSVLEAPADTVEPGSKAVFRVRDLTGNPPFRLSLDIDGDGRGDWQGDWQGDKPGAIPLVAGRSGRFEAVLSIADGRGLQGKSEASWVVNRRAKVEMLVKEPRVNLTTPAQFKIMAEDADDSLIRVQGFLSDTLPAKKENRPPWVAREPDKSETAAQGHALKAYWSQAWKRPGKYGAKGCVTGSDQRVVCAQTSVEVFNARPFCKILKGLKPVPGRPVEIRGEAGDPDGEIVRWEWDLDGDGRYELNREQGDPVHFTFARNGKFPVMLKVTTADGFTAKDSLSVEVKKSW